MQDADLAGLIRCSAQVRAMRTPDGGRPCQGNLAEGLKAEGELKQISCDWRKASDLRASRSKSSLL